MIHQTGVSQAVGASWNDPDVRGVTFDAKNAPLEVLEADEHHPSIAPAGVVVSIEFDDIDDLYDRLRRAGVEIQEPIGDRPRAPGGFTVGPNGLMLSLFKVLESPQEGWIGVASRF